MSKQTAFLGWMHGCCIFIISRVLMCESVFSVVPLCKCVWVWCGIGLCFLERDHHSQYHYGNKSDKRHCEMLFKMKKKKKMTPMKI